MTPSNSASWLDAVGAKLRVGLVESYKPEKGEVLIEIHAVAINPVDWAMQTMGILIETYPFVLGCDAAGVVVDVGEGVTHVSVGSRVLASMTALEGQRRGGNQKYAIGLDILTAPIPDEMSFTDAAVMPVCYTTAAAGLYMKTQLALPLPNLTPTKSGKTILLWGGATSVGCMAVQLAVASGVDVITTASPRNFELLKGLGAKEVFDYNSETVVEDITNALKGTEFAGVYEASGKEDAMKTSGEILSSLGGGCMAPVRHPIKDLPSNVRAEFVNSMVHKTEEPEGAKYVWYDFLPTALKSGQVKPAPPAEVVGSGLESIQLGIDTWFKGVSAKKIVIDGIN